MTRKEWNRIHWKWFFKSLFAATFATVMCFAVMAVGYVLLKSTAFILIVLALVWFATFAGGIKVAAEKYPASMIDEPKDDRADLVINHGKDYTTFTAATHKRGWKQ